MADEAIVAPAEESKPEPVTEAVKEETVSEMLGSKKEEPKMVPEAALIEIKKENKQMAKDLKALQRSIEDGATKKEVSTDLRALGEKHNVDPDFLQEFAAAVRSQAENDVKQEFDSKLKPLQDREKAAEIDQKFTNVFDKTMEELPEFKNIAKRETVKSLSLLPENANKTFRQILEDNFGHLIPGKRTLEGTKPRGGKDDAEIDQSRATKDPEYFKEIMSDPGLKKKYNDGLAKRLKL